MATPKVTVVEHEPACSSAYLVDWLAPTTELSVVRPYLGDAVPESNTDGLIVLGGTENALADTAWPWLPATRALLNTAVVDGTPSFNICLGHQLLGVAAGAELDTNSDAGPEYGPVTMQIVAPEDDALFGTYSGREVSVTMMHDDQLRNLPEGAVNLAYTDRTPIAAMHLGEASWSTQFHPEANASTLLGWLDTTPQLSAEDRKDILASYFVHSGQITEFAKNIVLNWRALM